MLKIIPGNSCPMNGVQLNGGCPLKLLISIENSIEIGS